MVPNDFDPFDILNNFGLQSVHWKYFVGTGFYIPDIFILFYIYLKKVNIFALVGN